jgi:methionyl-tRNA synthetase
MASPRSALSIVDSLISHVQGLSVAASSSIPPSTVSSSLSSSSSPVSSRLPVSTSDSAWHPIVPVGHTQFSWVGDSQLTANSIIPSSVQSVQINETASVAPSSATSSVPNAGKQKSASKTANPPAPAPASSSSSQPPFTRLDIRVGHVLSARKHPDADNLYIEQIDVGEEKPREIVSGLVKFVPLNELENSLVLVICNLKPAPLKNVMSYGMVLAAANEDRSLVELVRPPIQAKPGERIIIDGLDFKSNAPDSVIQPKKANNSWDAVKSSLKVNSEGIAVYENQPIRPTHSGGNCVVKSIKNAQIS